MTDTAPSQAALALCIRIRDRYKAPGNEHVLELDEAAREIDRFAASRLSRAEAVIAAAEAMRKQSHQNHWDRTGGSGSGCEACIEERRQYAELHAALAAYRSDTPEKET